MISRAACAVLSRLLAGVVILVVSPQNEIHTNYVEYVAEARDVVTAKNIPIAQIAEKADELLSNFDVDPIVPELLF